MSGRFRTPLVTVVALILIVSLSSSVFFINVGPVMEDPEPFEDTLIMGVSPKQDISQANERISVPKAQAYYTEYRYVIGYQSVQRLIAHQHREGHEQQFGQLAGLFVTDYSSTSLQLTAEGYPVVNNAPRWIDGRSAIYVVGSEASVNSYTPVIPFAEKADAQAFVNEYGGAIRHWEEIRDRQFDISDADRVRSGIDTKQEFADRLGDEVLTDKARAETLIVGESTETIQGTIDKAQNNSKIIIPNGTYSEHIQINKSITLSGSGNTTIRGHGNGTVVTITAENVGLSDVRIAGVGDSIRAESEGSQHALSMAYGGGDAGVLLRNASQSVVENVTIATPASGVLLRDSPETVIRGVSVKGAENWQDGYMGVLIFSSERSVVENSAFYQGRDGIYTEHADGLVFRDNRLERNRIGVHLMYTSNVVISNNTVENASHTGIHDMTNSRYNSFVNNTIRDSPIGLRTEGWYSYVARNMLVDNNIGMTTEAGNSIYEHNVLLSNDVGIQGSHILPTNRVTQNDFVANKRHATARRGPLRVWNGNYWEGALGTSDSGVLDQPYSATGPVDSRLHRVSGAPTLAHSPVQRAQDLFPGSVAGLRKSSIIDVTPSSDLTTPELTNRALGRFQNTTSR